MQLGIGLGLNYIRPILESDPVVPSAGAEWDVETDQPGWDVETDSPAQNVE